MSCKVDIQDIESFKNRMVNYKYGKQTLMPLPLKPNIEFTEKLFAVTNEVVASSKEGYVFKGTNDKINAKRVSDIIAQAYKGSKTPDEKSLAVAYSLNKALGAISQHFIDSYNNEPTIPLSAVKSKLIDAELGISDVTLDKLEEVAKSNVQDIINTQNKIDNSKKALIKVDQIVVDSTTDIAGTINLVAQYSDGTAALYDYITFTPKKSGFKQVSGQIVPITEGITGNRKISAKLGVANYAQILKNQANISNLRQARSVPIMLIKGKEGILRNIETFQSLPQEFKKNLQEIPAYFEYSDDESRNKALSNKITLKQERELKLKNTKRDTPEYNRLKNLILDLDRSIEDTQREAGLANLMEAIKVSTDALQDISNISNRDLNNYYTEILSFQSILEDEGTYFINKIQDPQDKRAAKAEKDILIGQLNEFQTLLEEELKGRTENIVIAEKVIPQKVVPNASMVDNFLEAESIGISHITAVARLFKQAQLKTTSASYKFIDKLQSIDDKVRKEFGTEGYNKIKDEKGNLIYRLSSQFYKDRDNADSAWFDKYYSLKPGAKERYDLLEAKQKEYLKTRYTAIANHISADKANEMYATDLAKWKEENSIENAKFNSNRNKYYSPNEKAYKDYTSVEYKAIEGTSLEELYNFLIGFNAEARDELDLDYFELPNTFYPWIKKDLIDRLNILDKDNYETLKQDILNVTAIRQEDTTFGDIDPQTNEPLRRIPKFFTQPFRDADGNILYNNRSNDLIKDYIIFAKMVYNHKYMSEIEDEVSILQNGLKLAEFEVQDVKGKTVVGKYGEKIVKGSSVGGAAKAVELMNIIVNNKLYGIKVDPSLSTVIGPKMVKAIDSINAKNNKMKLGLKVIPAFVSFAAGKFASANMAKKLGFGFIDAEKEFWTRSKEVQDFLVEVSPYAEDPIALKARMKSKSNVNKVLNSENFYIFFAVGERALTSVNAVMVAKSYGFDSEGNLKQLKNLPEGSKSAYELLTTNELNESQTDYFQKLSLLRGAIKTFNSKAYGTLAHDDVAAWQSNVLLKSIMAFKSWMPGVLNERVGSLRYNQALDYLDIGTHRALYEEFQRQQGQTIVDHITKTVLPKIATLIGDLATFGYISRGRVNEQSARIKYEEWSIKNPNEAKLTSFEDYVAIKRKQIGYALREVRAIIALYTLILAMGLEGGDDEPYYKQNIALRNTYRILNKSLAEIGFAYTPSEFTRLLNNPIPAISVLKQVGNTLSNTGDEIRDEVVGENSNRDKTPVLYYTSQWINGFSGVAELFELTEQDKNKTYESR